MQISRGAARLVLLLLLLLSAAPRQSASQQEEQERWPDPAAGDTIVGRIYRVVASHRMAYCTQLATAGRTLGCRARPAGNVGRVRWLVVADNNATTTGDDDDDDAVIGVVDLAEFVRLWRANFTGTGTTSGGGRRLAGLIVLLTGREANDSRQGLAELAQCGLSADAAVAAAADDACVDGLAGVAAQFSIPFPVVLLAASTLEAVTGQTLQQLQRQRQLWAALTFSYAGIGSGRDCLQRQRLLHSQALGQYVTGQLDSSSGPLCQLLAETSLAWSVAELPTGRGRQPASVLLVVARLDAFSVFSNWAAGAAQLRPSLAVVLALAGALADWAKSSPPSARAAWADRDVLLLLLTGESYGHLASRSVARRLLGGSPGGLLGGPGQPAGVRAGHLHSAIEVGPLGFARSPPGRQPRQFRFVGVGPPERLRGHRGVAGVDVADSTAFPAWSTLGHLAPAAGGLAGLLLTDLHGNGSGQLRYPDWNSFTDLSADAEPAALTEAAAQLIRLAVSFLLNGSDAAAAAAAVPGDLSDRVARAAACLDPVGGGRGGVCRDLLMAGSVVGGGAAALARSLERWRRLGVDASLGGLSPTEGGGGGSREEASGMRLLVESLLLRYTLREGGGGGGSCSGKAATDQEPPVRGYQWRHPNGTVTCRLSSITSFPVGDADSGAEAAWALSTQATFPSLSLFVRQPDAAQLPALGLGLALALLWGHLTASAASFFLRQRGRRQRE